MASQSIKNTFEGGINGDLSGPNIAPNQFLFSKNLSLIGDGKFTALQNIKGTTTVNTISSTSGAEILAVFQNKYKIGTTENVNCLTIFTATTGGNIKIYCNDLDNNIIYELYQKSTPGDYLSSDRVIDGISYAESGLDILYFTDFYYGPRKLRCEIPLPYSANFLTDNDLHLVKKAAIGNISLVNVTSGGSLLTGTYQLAHQLINTSKNKYSKFSLLTTPIHVYTTINGLVYAGIGLPSNKKIITNIGLTDDELAEYTHFRVAIVENVYPEGTDVNTLSQIGLSRIESISSYLSGSTITNYEIKSNVQTDSVSIDDIVIDLAAIEKVKTLEIRDNKLLLGNVSFKNLNYNNGTPSISGGTVLKQSDTGDSFSSDLFTSRYKGHFRNEVYRYAISYFDDYGNFSSPKTLNLSSVTYNQISGATDFKFPDRSQLISGTYFTVFNSSNNTESLGLQLAGINNHPTWARGFVILRAKRKKNIQFQTPIIPLTAWYAIGAVGNYPGTYKEGLGPTDVTVDNAIPMGPNTVYMPYNLMYGAQVSAGSNVSTNGGSGVNNRLIGENSGMLFATNYSSAAVYPPQTMYSSSSYVFTGSEQLRSVDAAICRLYFSRFDNESYNCGLGINTDCSGSFFASLNNDYYYNNGHGGGKPGIRDYISSTYVNTVTANKNFDNYSEGAIVGGRNVVMFDKLQTPNITFGFKANTQRFTAITLGDSITSLGGPNGSYLSFASGTPTYTAETFTILNTSEYIKSSTGLHSSYVNTIEIVNVLSGYDDTRYGSADDFNEFIFTGTKVVFTTSELATVAAGGSLPKTVDVWGGDCIVSPHTFKIGDTGYVVVNQPKLRTTPAGESVATVISKFGKTWTTDNSNGSSVTLPVAVKGTSQYLTIVLESEYHGSVRDLDTYESIGTYNFPIKGTTTQQKVRAPLTYNYNINLSKENDQKIFVPIDPTQPVTYNYKSRIYYTDQKIYQTNIEGFDTIRVLNYKDLQERFGGITKLQVSGDNLYSLQESGVAYIPVGERIIEATNTSQLGVRSSDFLGDPVYIDTIRGCQHLRTVRETGNSFYFVDNKNKSIYSVAGQSLENITNRGFLTLARGTSILGNTIPEKQLLAIYDPLRGEYWLIDKVNNFAYIWNEKFGVWVSDYTFPTGLGGGRFTKNNLYLVGKDFSTSNVTSGTMYTGNVTQLFGLYPSEVYVDFVINPMPDLSKTFDDILLTSSDRLETFDLTVERESILGNQVATGMNLDVTSRGEGTHRIKILRDSSGARMRGIFGKARVNWPTGVSSPQVNLYSVNTVFRPSI